MIVAPTPYGFRGIGDTPTYQGLWGDSGMDAANFSNKAPALATVPQQLCRDITTLAAVGRTLFAGNTEHTNTANVVMTCARFLFMDTRSNGKRLAAHLLVCPVDHGTGNGYVEVKTYTNTSGSGVDTYTADTFARAYVTADIRSPGAWREIIVPFSRGSASSLLREIRIREKNCRVMRATIVELPETQLDTIADLALDPAIFSTGRPIDKDDIDNLRTKLHDLLTSRNATVWAQSWWLTNDDAAGANTIPLSVTSTTYINPLLTSETGWTAVGAGPDAYSQYAAMGKDTTKRHRCAVLARMTGTTDTGTVRFANEADTADITIAASTTWTWYGQSGADPTVGEPLDSYAAGGTLGDPYGDKLIMLAKRNGTTDTLEIGALTVYADDAT